MSWVRVPSPTLLSPLLHFPPNSLTTERLRHIPGQSWGAPGPSRSSPVAGAWHCRGDYRRLASKGTCHFQRNHDPATGASCQHRRVFVGRVSYLARVCSPPGTRDQGPKKRAVGVWSTASDAEPVGCAGRLTHRFRRPGITRSRDRLAGDCGGANGDNASATASECRRHFE